MWKAIQANKIKSIVLISLMGVLLLLTGGFAGGYLAGTMQGVLLGIGISGFLWFILTFAAVFEGEGIFLSISGARQISHDDAPQLYNVVEEMKIAAALPAVPRVFIIESPAMNAFAVGSPEKASIAVTRGLLEMLSREELQGVVAHEIGHIKNQDTKFMTIAGIMLGAIVLIAEFFSNMIYFQGVTGGSSRDREDSDSDSGKSNIVFTIIAIVLAIIAPILANIIYLACSRSREYLADASAALFTRYPEGLASALEKISSDHTPLETANKVTAPMYIINPLELDTEYDRGPLFSTHPATAERVKILRAMASGAGLSEYNEAFRTATGKNIFNAESMRPEAEQKLRGL